MTKETIIYLRTTLKDECNNAMLTIIADNMIYFRESIVQLKWDDDHELLWALRQNQETRENYKWPVQIQAVSYECIQYIGVDLPGNLARIVAKDVGFDEGKANAFIDSLDLQKNPPL